MAFSRKWVIVQQTAPKMSNQGSGSHGDGCFKPPVLPSTQSLSRPNTGYWTSSSQSHPKMSPNALLSPYSPSKTLTSSSAFIDFSFIRSWKQSKLLVPKDCNSSSLQRATNWGRSRCPRVSGSSNSLEKRSISFVLGLWLVWTLAVGTKRLIKMCFLLNLTFPTTECLKDTP